MAAGFADTILLALGLDITAFEKRLKDSGAVSKTNQESFVKDTKNISSASAGLQLALTGVKTAIEGLFAAIAGFEFTKFIADSIKTTEAISNLAKVLDVPIGKLSAFLGAFKTYAGDANEMSAALLHIKTDLIDKIKLGYQPDEKMNQYFIGGVLGAEKIPQDPTDVIKSIATRAAKAGVPLLPILQDFHIRNVGNINAVNDMANKNDGFFKRMEDYPQLSQANAKAADAWTSSLAVLGGTVLKVGADIATMLAPLTSLINLFTTIVKPEDWLGPGAGSRAGKATHDWLGLPNLNVGPEKQEGETDEDVLNRRERERQEGIFKRQSYEPGAGGRRYRGGGRFGGFYEPTGAKPTLTKTAYSTDSPITSSGLPGTVDQHEKRIGQSESRLQALEDWLKRFFSTGRGGGVGYHGAAEGGGMGGAGIEPGRPGSGVGRTGGARLGRRTGSRSEEGSDTGEVSGNLGEDRQKFADELQRNPKLKQDLWDLAEAEVGGQGPAAKQAFIESVMNRASARGQTLDRAIHDRGYYPKTTTGKVGGGRGPAAEGILKNVLGGGNISNYATGNASGNVRFAGGPQTFDPHTGERFGTEGPDVGWANRMRRHADSSPAVDQAFRGPGHESEALAGAEAVLRQGGDSQAVKNYLSSVNVTKDDNWCADFVTAYAKRAGITPPRNPAMATSWRNVGSEVLAGQERPGDIAVRRDEYAYHGHGHVGIVSGSNNEPGQFGLTQGNPARVAAPTAESHYQFYRPRQTELATPRIPKAAESPAVQQHFMQHKGVSHNDNSKVNIGNLQINTAAGGGGGADAPHHVGYEGGDSSASLAMRSYAISANNSIE